MTLDCYLVRVDCGWTRILGDENFGRGGIEEDGTRLYGVGAGDVFGGGGVQEVSSTVLERPCLFKFTRVLMVAGVFAMLAGTQQPSNRLLLAQAANQTPESKNGSQNGSQMKIRVNSNLVILPVTVKDRYGNLVADMERQDFRVFDDGVEQSIDVFTAEAFPLSILVLV